MSVSVVCLGTTQDVTLGRASVLVWVGWWQFRGEVAAEGLDFQHV